MTPRTRGRPRWRRRHGHSGAGSPKSDRLRPHAGGGAGRELKDIAGHDSAKETDRYTRQAERAVMARSGMAKLKWRIGAESVPPGNGLER